MNGKIYKITNTVNGDSYIGQTINEVTDRFSQHKGGIFQSKRNHSKLQKAMVEYGVNNFRVETIEENIATMAELSAKETYYIVQFGTSNQYNGNYGNGPKANRPSKQTRKEPKRWLKRVKNREAIAYHPDLIDLNFPKLTAYDWDLFFYFISKFQNSENEIIEVDFDEISKETGRKDPSPSGLIKILDSFNSKCDLLTYCNFDYDSYLLSVELNEKYNYIVNDITNDFVFIDKKYLNSLSEKSSKKLYRSLAEKRNKQEITYTCSELRHILDNEKYDIRKFHTRILNKTVEELQVIFKDLKLEKIKRGTRIISYRFTWSGYNDNK